MALRIITLVCAVLLSGAASARETIALRAADGLEISADLYRAKAADDAPWVVLAHQAGASRGEYRKIAPRLSELGYNAIAIDQRSGKDFAGVRNGTAQRAAARGVTQNYAAAEPDIAAAIAWVRKRSKAAVLLWGSSYSAALAIWMAGDTPALVDGVVAMSPGEYIRGRVIAKAAAKIKVPVLMASPANERSRWQRMFRAIPGEQKIGYAPKSGGRHGSSALIASRNASSGAYWEVVERFLKKYFPTT